MAGGYAFIGYLAVSGRPNRLLAAVALLAFVALACCLLTRFEFRVGANEIPSTAAILSRTSRSIPFDRIQDVDIIQDRSPDTRIAKVNSRPADRPAGTKRGAAAIPLKRAEERGR